MNIYNYTIATIGGIVGIFLGGYDGFLYALAVFVGVDYVTGVLGAIKTKKLNSEVGFWGLVKKILVFMIVGIANILDLHIFGFNSVMRTAVIFFFLSNEGLSILENMSVLGIDYPDKLKNVLSQLKDKDTKK